MAELSTIARPYARAVFELAGAGNTLDKWSDMLTMLAQVVDDDRVRPLLTDPKVSEERRVEIILAICSGHLDEHGQNFVRVLNRFKRLDALPAIAQRFEVLKAESEGTIDVEVTSVTPVDENFRNRLAQGLRTRLGRDVRLHCTTDPSLIGGAVIRAGDMVIDGSVRGRLDKLAGVLAN